MSKARDCADSRCRLFATVKAKHAVAWARVIGGNDPYHEPRPLPEVLTVPNLGGMLGQRLWLHAHVADG